MRCRAARSCTRDSPTEAEDAETGNFAKSGRLISSPMLPAQTRDLGTSKTTWGSPGPAVRDPAGRHVLPFQALILGVGIPKPVSCHAAGLSPSPWCSRREPR